MAKILCLFICLSVVSYVSALKCYDCPVSCPTDISQLQQNDCGKSSSDKMCLKQVIQTKEGSTRTIRKCVLLNPQHEYKCIEAPGDKTLSCDTCKSDLCNSANSIRLGFFGIIGATLILLAPKYLLN